MNNQSISTHGSSERYLADKKISEGVLFELWQGTDRISRRQIVIKRPRAAAQVGDANLGSVLRDSFEASRFWKHPGVLAPLAGYERNGVFEVVSRYLPPERRISLTRELFREHFDQIVPQLFAAVEFIHLKGFVHCDLNPGNIFLEVRPGRVRLIVGDLDLLRPVGAKPKGKIIGTHPYIAPEILDDEIIVARSDHYSLGILLAQLSSTDEQLREKLADNSTMHTAVLASLDLLPELVWLAPIISALTQRHYQLRPFSLVRTLADHRRELVPSGFDKALFWHDLRSEYRRAFGASAAGNFALTKFLKASPRVFGIPGELATFLDHKMNGRPHVPIRIARLIIGESDFTRNGDRWSIKLPLQTAKKVIGLLEPESTIPGQGMSAKVFLRHGLRLALSGNPLTAAIWLESALSPQSPHYLPDRSNAILLQIAKLYRQAGFRTDADEILKQLLQSATLSPRKRIAVLHGMVDALQSVSLRSEQWQLLGQAYGLARKLGSNFWRLKTVDKMLWSRFRAGNLAGAYPLARKVDRFADKVASPRAAGGAANTVGSFELFLSRFVDAKQSYLRALERLSESGSEAQYSVRGNLAYLLTEFGDYQEAIALANEPGSRRPLLADSRRSMQVDLNAMAACSFVGDIETAEKLASRYSAAAQMRGDAAALAWLTLSLGRIYLRCGRFDEARENLESASAYFSDSGNLSFLGQSNLFLGLLNAWRGNIAIAAELNKAARDIFAKTREGVWQLDSRQLDLQIEREISGKVKSAKALELIADYLKCHNPLGAMFTLALLLLDGEFCAVDKILKDSTEAANFARNSGAVVGKAVALHLKALKAAAKSAKSPDMALLREVLIYYRKIGFYYHAAGVAKTLADEYLRQEKTQLARGFLQEYLRLATVIGNSSRLNSARQQLEQLTESLGAASTKHLALLELSRLLNSFDDFDVTTEKLLAFALDQTGAERAALLLPTEGGADLRVERFIACDKMSLEDILSMSRTVMKSVFENKEPMIISDAQNNEITREYRSVIKHNIYSIACVPLISGKDVVGVLYLDHHSLPSVFSVDQHRLIEAVANFIAVVLFQARQFDMSQRRSQELNSVHEALGLGDKFITRNKYLIDLIEKLPRVADSHAAILLLGESGTGKEVLAQIIHQNSPYRDGTLVTLNCSLYSGKVMESELFGIEKGMATGVDRKVGKIQLADGGTLFLDELGELTPTMQAKLLRVLENKEVSMIGSVSPRKVNFRLIAATNRNLTEMIEQGTFRKDLYYRINTIKIHLTPLRERPEDLEPLIDHFMEKFAPGRPAQFTRSAWRLVSEYSWPGNVRELKNLIERISILHPGGPIRENVLSTEIRDAVKSPQAVPLREHTDQTEKALVARILTECGWNQAEAARRLGIPYSTLQRKVRKYRIKGGKINTMSSSEEKNLILQTLINCRWNLTKAASQLSWKLSTLKSKIKAHKIRNRRNAD